MGQFFLVSGTGKTGTSWLAEALNHPRAGIMCLDEGKLAQSSKLRQHLGRNRLVRRVWSLLRTRRSWLESMDNRLFSRDEWLESAEYEIHYGVGPRYAKYFRAIESNLAKYAAVGDSHSWEAHQIPDVNQKITVGKIIHLVRDGIPNVHALWALNQRLFEANPIFRRQWEINQKIFGGSYTTAWQLWCRYWSINSKIPGWLRENLPDTQIDVYRLEDLTSDPAHLTEILEGLARGSSNKIGNLISILAKNDDRDQTGNRDPETIWKQWSPEQRSDFQSICGETMEIYGYELP